jgi:hypothetical protein
MSTEAIVLTDRPPVRIDPEHWPIIASAVARVHEAAYHYTAPSPRTWRRYITVRQHTDGRMIVYARSTYDTAYQGEHGYDYEGGELLGPEDDPIPAIRRVAHKIGGKDPDEQERWRHLADECIGSLPAEDLT